MWALLVAVVVFLFGGGSLVNSLGRQRNKARIDTPEN